MTTESCALYSEASKSDDVLGTNPTPNHTKQLARSRIAYLDVIRVAAIALVIVNHTDGSWMLSLETQSPNWWFAVIYFFCCKIAVPLFVMVSGALLLPRRDSYRKTGARVLRIAVVLLAASAFYYLVGTGEHTLAGFADKFWHAKISGHLWYLYMYIGLLAMMPLLQKLAASMQPVDYLYFFVVCFGFVNLVPVAAQFFPPAAYTTHLQLPLFGGYIGMLMAGHYIANVTPPLTRSFAIAAVAVFLTCLAFLTLGTGYFYDIGGGADYLKLDNRTFTPIVLMAACIFALVRFSSSRHAKAQDAEGARRSWGAKLLDALAVCSFGMYLVHPYLITLFHPYFLKACEAFPDIFALLLFEVVVFAVSFVVTWLLRLIPPVRKVL